VIERAIQELGGLMRSRVRTLLLGVVVAGSVLLAPAGVADAATGKVQAVVTCDPTTNTITASVSSGAGWFAPNSPVTVEFQVYAGSYVTTAGTSGMIPTGSRTTVAATTAADGSLSVTGYTRSWQAANYLFYTETARVTVRNGAGQWMYERDGTCTHDLRTTVTLDCDREAHTITARAAGVNYRANGTVRVSYLYSTTSQASAGSPRFTSSYAPYPYATPHTVTASAAGTWSDVGYVIKYPTGDPYYLDQRLQVEVRDGSTGWVVGRGSAYCLYADQRQ
jgi:hypothetical protein